MLFSEFRRKSLFRLVNVKFKTKPTRLLNVQINPGRPALWLATRASKMELSYPLGTTRRVPQEKFARKPYNKSFIDQGCSVKMAGYWPRSFFCELMDLDSVSVHNLAKKELDQYPAILTSHLVNNSYISHLLSFPSGWCNTHSKSAQSWQSCVINQEALRPIYWCVNRSQLYANQHLFLFRFR